VIIFFWIQILIAPFLTLFLAVTLNLFSCFQMTVKKKKFSQICLKLLRACYTASNVTTFAIALISITKVMPYVLDSLFNDNKFCDLVKAHTKGGETKQCLSVVVERSSGVWFLIAWGLSLDLFATSTLYFHQGKFLE